MARVTVTMPEDTRREVERAARRKGKSFSATATELIQKQLAEQRTNSPFEALIGIVSKELPYPAAEIDAELQKSLAESIEADRG